MSDILLDTTKEKAVHADRPRRISYRPSNVKDIVIEMKNATELMLDFAYSSILFSEEDFGEEVLELQKKVEDLRFNGRVAVMLAARGMKEIKSLAGVLQIVNASANIGAAAVDLAKIELTDLGLPRSFIKTLHLVEETMTGTVIPKESRAASARVSYIEGNTKMRLIAIKQASGRWIFNPADDQVVNAGDRIFVKGPFEALTEFEIFVSGRHDAFPSLSEITESKALREIREILVEMMSLSELSIDLAFSSILFNNRDIADEVSKIEDRLEILRSELETKVLVYAKEAEDVRSLRGLLRIAYSSEKLSDASKEISDLVFHGTDALHPILLYAMKETDEIIIRVKIDASSAIDGKTVAETNFEVETGMDIIALHKEKTGKWIYNPKGDVLFEANDVLIAKGSRDSEPRVRGLAGFSTSTNNSGDAQH